MKCFWPSVILFAELVYGIALGTGDEEKSFTIDYDNNRFLLDGKPFRYISGDIHYYRIHPQQWDDRLKRIRAAGLNAVQFYVPWNFHELFKGKYLFSGSRNLTHFFDLVIKNDLFILLRIGPYTCAEWENGALPWWLIRDKNITMRTMDPRYTVEVKRWFDVLLPKLVPYLRRNGGPILMVQPDNEYGSYFACDHAYLKWLSDLIKSHLGSDVVQFSTDGPGDSYLKCGVTPGVYPTVDFGPAERKDIDSFFAAQRRFAPKGPLVNSEFYPGWLVLWGQQSEELPDIQSIVNSSQYLYDLGASFNYYMIQGGTNFGFWNGAEITAPVITSYDFSAPLSEAGDATEKYLAIRDWIKSLKDWPTRPKDIPKDNPKANYGKVKMRSLGTLTNPSLLKVITRPDTCATSKYPMSFEDLNHPLGFVLYHTTLKIGGSNLSIPILKDHGFTILEDEPQGVFVDIFGNYSRRWVPLKGAQPGKRLAILVENRGRQTYETINDFKGILSNVTLDGRIIEDWTQCGIHLKLLDREMRRSVQKRYDTIKATVLKSNRMSSAGVYYGTFTVNKVVDTFFDPTGWGKGQLFINGHNIGRYWPEVGPQITLYVPAPFLRRHNSVLMLELSKAGNCAERSCAVHFIDHPVFNFTQNSFSVLQQPKRFRSNL